MQFYCEKLLVARNRDPGGLYRPLWGWRCKNAQGGKNLAGVKLSKPPSTCTLCQIQQNKVRMYYASEADPGMGGLGGHPPPLTLSTVWSWLLEAICPWHWGELSLISSTFDPLFCIKIDKRLSSWPHPDPDLHYYYSPKPYTLTVRTRHGLAPWQILICSSYGSVS